MALYESSIKSLPRIGKGKVRDIYAVGNDKMLIVTSDRLSAFDVVLADPIPDKGRVLNSRKPSRSSLTRFMSRRWGTFTHGSDARQRRRSSTTWWSLSAGS